MKVLRLGRPRVILHVTRVEFDDDPEVMGWMGEDRVGDGWSFFWQNTCGD